MLTQTWTIQGNGFHFGQHGLGQEETSATFPSDSLFAALLARLAVLRGKDAITELMAPFLQRQPTFVLTSTFPMAGAVRFFPLPLSAQRASPSGDSAQPVKQLKKVAFLSEKLFLEILAGKTLFEIFQNALTLQSGQLLLHPAEINRLPEHLQKLASPKIWHIEQRPRVALGRSAQQSTIFFTGRLAFAQGCGLWFAVRWLNQEPSTQALLESLLHDLADAGLGGERSVGFGAFSLHPGTPLSISPASPADTWVSLSRYNPSPEEMPALQAPQSSYSIHTVTGWLESPARRGLRRRPLRMLAEGSVFGPLSQEVPGRILDVRPDYAKDTQPLDHPVYRCGLAFKVGIQTPGGQS
jgi:CRISPR-associated protein Csm4